MKETAYDIANTFMSENPKPCKCEGSGKIHVGELPYKYERHGKGTQYSAKCGNCHSYTYDCGSKASAIENWNRGILKVDYTDEKRGLGQLLPCKCGKGIIYTENSYKDAVRDRYRVACSGCGVRTQLYITMQEVVDAWNHHMGLI